MSTWDVIQGSGAAVVVEQGAATITGVAMEARPFMVAVSHPLDVAGLINSLRNDSTIAIKLPDDAAERLIKALQALSRADA